MNVSLRLARWRAVCQSRVWFATGVGAGGPPPLCALCALCALSALGERATSDDKVKHNARQMCRRSTSTSRLEERVWRRRGVQVPTRQISEWPLLECHSCVVVGVHNARTSVVRAVLTLCKYSFSESCKSARVVERRQWSAKCAERASASRRARRSANSCLLAHLSRCTLHYCTRYLQWLASLQYSANHLFRCCID